MFAKSQHLDRHALDVNSDLIAFAQLTFAYSTESVNGVPTLSARDIHALLPRNRGELRYGALLSVNAGVVEELLFRLAFPVLIFAATDSAASRRSIRNRRSGSCTSA